MKRCLGSLALAAIALFADTSRADGPDANACVDAYVRGQALRGDRQLVEARDALRICAQPTCNDFIVKDCTTWLDEVQASLPTVVPIATDEAGNELARVRLTLDQKVLAEQLDGRSIEVNPGSHTVTFEPTDGAQREAQTVVVLVAEAEKNKRIAVTLAKRGAHVAAALIPTVPITPLRATAALVPAASSASSPAQGQSSSPWKTTGMAAAGVGAVGVGVSLALGVVASGKKSDAGCNSNSVCPSETAVSVLRNAKSVANLSTAFFIVGGVLAASGISLWLFAPGTVQAAPAVDHGTAGFVLRGLW